MMSAGVTSSSEESIILEAVNNSPQPTTRISYPGNLDGTGKLAYSCRGNAAWEALFQPTPATRSAMSDEGAAPSCVHPDDAQRYAEEAAAAMQRRQRQHISCARFVSGAGAVFSACEVAVFEYGTRDSGRSREGAPAGGSAALPLLRSVTLSYSHIRRLSGPSSSTTGAPSQKVVAAQPAHAAPAPAVASAALPKASQPLALPVHTPLTAFDTPVARSASGGITLAAGYMAAFNARLAIAKYHALQAASASAATAAASTDGASIAGASSRCSPSSAASTATVHVDAANVATASASPRASTAELQSSASPSSLSVLPSAPPSPLVGSAAPSAAAEPAGLLSPLGQLLRARHEMSAGHSEPLPPQADAGAASAAFGAYQQSMTSRLLQLPLSHLPTGPRKLLSPSILAPLQPQPSASSASSSSASGGAADSSSRPAPRAFPPVPRMFAELTEGRSAWAAAAASAHLAAAEADVATKPAFKDFSGAAGLEGGASSSSSSSSSFSGLMPFGAFGGYGGYGGYDYDSGLSLSVTGASTGSGAGATGVHRVANLAATAALKASVAASVRLQLPSRDQWQRLADSSPFPALLRAADLPVPPPFVMKDSARHHHDDDAAVAGSSSSSSSTAAAGAFADLLKQPPSQPQAADAKPSAGVVAVAMGGKLKRSRKDALGSAPPSAAAGAMGMGLGMGMGMQPYHHAAKHFAALPGASGVGFGLAADSSRGLVQSEPAILPGLGGSDCDAESDSESESHGYGGFNVSSAAPSSCAAAVKSAAPLLSLHRPWSLLDLDIDA